MTPLKIAMRAVLLCLALASLPARADVTLNLKDAEISTLIATVSEVTGKNFIVDSRVKGKVTVISSSPMSADGLYETFLAVLAVNGFAAVPAGDTIKIIPETNARWEGSSYGGDAGGLAKDEIVTKVFPVQNVSATQLVPILRPMIPQWGHLGAYQPSNILIISDRAANVRRLEQLIRQMDQVGDRDIESFKLENASAAEVVRILTALTQQDKQADPSMRQTAIIADERSNSVLIGGDRTERGKYRDIIRQLDQPVTDGGATQVVYLRYATAENLAPILEGYAQEVAKSDSKSSAGGAAPAAAPAASSGGGGRDGIRVLSDKDTNALIITAPPKAMRQIRDVIAQLDIQRSQVLVEAIIAEVSATTSNQLGVDWAVFNKERIAAAGILNPSTSQALSNAASALGNSSSSSGNTATAALSLLGLGATAAGGIINDNGTSFGLLLKALKGDGSSNILSTPTLLTMDNEEAKFSVGQEVPFLTGSFSNTGSGSSTVNPFQTIERKDVGLTLGVTPQINEGNVVKLKIDLESSSLTASADSTLQQTTNKRTLTNTVVVETGQVLVIGGLTDDKLNDSKNQVPFLGDLPLLGNLFRARAVKKDKSNLMVFIRPTILRKQSEADYYTRKKYDAVRQAQIDSAKVTQSTGRQPMLKPYDVLMSDAPPPPPVTEQQVPPPSVAGQARPQPPAPPATN
ncbi:type II secretion system protein GspD [Solimonas sp. K1W22B-7]|uniref:type II secretion system secretin GspD n=1 Tax=Solimonas sp. K1W22B-7 TaxID=2303331 RepID=UPI000E330BF0|nr:type II secretion system secretin GspD [Solimonas sp. K1W22B-7]AXQ29138.1 type II secretion system protein GspD [Solimonas sp. K1W22B-7]